MDLKERKFRDEECELKYREYEFTNKVNSFCYDYLQRKQEHKVAEYKEEYDRAMGPYKTTSVAAGVLGLFFTGLLGGVLYLCWNPSKKSE